jgi:hypothetical protein
MVNIVGTNDADATVPEDYVKPPEDQSGLGPNPIVSVLCQYD